MKLPRAIPNSKIVRAVLSAAVLAAAVSISLAVAGATGGSREAEAGQTITKGDITVTLDAFSTDSKETKFTYSYRSAMGAQFEMIDIPEIKLPDGRILKSKDKAATPGRQGTKDGKFPPIPSETNSVSLDLSSAIVYKDSAKSVSFSLGDKLDNVNLEDLPSRTDISLDIPFSVGGAQFKFTSLILFTDTFAMVYKPVNGEARSRVFGGGLSAVSLSDDREGKYDSFLSGASWNTGGGDGHSVEFQGMYFKGLPNPDAGNFNLSLSGTGEIEGPFVFEVQLP